MENENIKDHWIGVFTSDNGIAEIDFTKVLISKKILLKPLSEVVSEEKTENLYSRPRKSIGE